MFLSIHHVTASAGCRPDWTAWIQRGNLRKWTCRVSSCRLSQLCGSLQLGKHHQSPAGKEGRDACSGCRPHVSHQGAECVQQGETITVHSIGSEPPFKAEPLSFYCDHMCPLSEYSGERTMLTPTLRKTLGWNHLTSSHRSCCGANASRKMSPGGN